GVDHDLVVKPFGRKGENFTMRDFDRGAMQFHFGIQPQELFGLDDEDGDGVVREVSIGEMSALHIFDVSNPRPRKDPLTSKALIGKGLFNTIGCTMCHKPKLVTQYRHVPVSQPEVPEDPAANIYYAVDLTTAGFTPDPFGPGVIVPLFADLKRHYMGPGLEEDFDAFHGAEFTNGEFTTARLWGIADTEPYLHDGRATTLHDAISMHGGEALTARNNYAALSNFGQEALIAYLKTLRTPDGPNQDLLPIDF
ncbi:MAG: di-heme oxidoredictase family protein, partial [Acidobacteriota bacterium]